MGIVQDIRLVLDEGQLLRIEHALSASLARGTDSPGANRNLSNMEKQVERIGNRIEFQWRTAIARAFNNAVIRGFTQDIIRLSVDGFETASKFVTVFGDEGAASLQKFIDKYATMMGLNQNVAREFLATAGSITEGMGASREEAAKMSEQVLRMAGDITSFSNVPIERAFSAIRSRITGELEPLRNLGIVITENDVQLRAMADSGKKAASDLTALDKATAVLALTQEKMGVMTGDLARTQDSASNTARRMGAEWENVKIGIANGLLPSFIKILKVLDQNKAMVQAFGDTLGFLSRITISGVIVVLQVLARTFLGLTAIGQGFLVLVRNSMAALHMDTKAIDGWIDSTADAIVRTKALLKAGDDIIESLKKPGTLITGSGGSVPILPPAGGGKKPGQEEKEFDKRLALMQRAAKFETSRAIALNQMAIMEAQLRKELENSNLSLEERTKKLEQLGQIEAARASRPKGETDRQISDLSTAMGTEDTRISAMTQLLQLQQQLNAALDEEVKKQDESAASQDRIKTLQEQIADIHQKIGGLRPEEALADSIRVMEAQVIDANQGIMASLKLVLGEAGLVAAAVKAISQGSAKKALQELAKEAKGKALWNLAMAGEAAARAGFALATGNPGQAAALAHTVPGFLAMAAKWGATAAGLGAIAGIGGGGGGGGDTASTDPGAGAASQAQNAPAIVNIWVDGLDPANNRHLALFNQTKKMAEEVYGVAINVDSASNAPAPSMVG